MLQEKLNKLYEEIGDKDKLLIASKNREASKIKELLDAGHRLFGENRVQEAKEKWPNLKKQYSNIKLHLIGPLQTNKIKDAIRIFDCIETLDREKLALKIKQYAPNMPCYIQINTGEEPQKSGIIPKEFPEFLDFCKNDCDLNIQGLMCIPPKDEAASLHFALLAKIAQKYNIPNLSMGMSNDYKIALEFGTSHVRIGSYLFK